MVPVLRAWVLDFVYLVIFKGSTALPTVPPDACGTKTVFVRLVGAFFLFIALLGFIFVGVAL